MLSFNIYLAYLHHYLRATVCQRSFFTHHQISYPQHQVCAARAMQMIKSKAIHNADCVLLYKCQPVLMNRTLIRTEAALYLSNEARHRIICEFPHCTRFRELYIVAKQVPASSVILVCLNILIISICCTCVRTL